jgi:hypothetical protein
MLVVIGQSAPSFRGIDIGDLTVNPLEFVGEGALILTLLARRLLEKPVSVSAMDVAMGLVDGLLSDLYTGTDIER